MNTGSLSSSSVGVRFAMRPEEESVRDPRLEDMMAAVLAEVTESHSATESRWGEAETRSQQCENNEHFGNLEDRL